MDNYIYCRDLTPVANATHSVTQLRHMLEENKPEPSLYIVGLCDTTCTESLQRKVTSLSSRFLSAFNQACDIIYHVDMEINAMCDITKIVFV